MTKKVLEFSGERFVPDESGEKLAADHLERYKFAAGYVAGVKVLDVACGSGYGAPMMMEGGATSYQGVDIGEEAVDYARQRYAGEGINYTVGDIRNYGEDQAYDLVTSFETIEHIPFYREAISNLYRVLKPGGRLIISSPNRTVSAPMLKKLSDPPPNRFHTQEFVPDELIAELQAVGFSLETATIFGQRQRRHFKSKWLRKLHRRLFGNPNKVTTARVEPVLDKSPKYFLLIAIK